MLHTLIKHLPGLLLAAATFASLPAHAEQPAKVRLYTLDCGRAEFKDMGMFADTGEYDGKPGKVVMPCYLIRHPKGNLLWDTGLADAMAGKPEGHDAGNGIRLFVTTTLGQQLQNLGLASSDIQFVAFSHFHFDHTGNANAFPGATWILNKSELAYALATPTPFGIDPNSFSAYKNAKTQLIDSDLDVFGDGSVRILKTPGHTPGHQVLQLKLAKTGTVILSGDLYHTLENRKFARVPGFNAERADTLASIDRVEKIVKHSKARFVVQHAPEDFKAMPRFPAWLE
ncbi:MAG: N-acyl homoserine lactonase family protein [Rhodocyclaceae bacterium]